ncbi:MAG: 6-carboxytetrahydropterin synthase [Chitinophagaceae bacterium]|nr:6-carboxytetrahydropterin synthase [Chitinophagaceae bacterium]
MILLTKIFRFEASHAIHEYPGLCKNIHGHSYKLLVSVTNIHPSEMDKKFGFVMDFKALKTLVNIHILDYFDHQLIVSKKYLKEHQNLNGLENIIVWDLEPSAENMILFIQKKLETVLPSNIKLVKLKLFETADSFIELNYD